MSKINQYEGLEVGSEESDRESNYERNFSTEIEIVIKYICI